MNKPNKILEKLIGYKFRNKNLLLEALTHPSYRHEINPNGEDNQRLEYLGDAVLGLITADNLYHEYLNESEGKLSSIRSWYTKDETLFEIAKEIDLGSYILFGKGELINNGSKKLSNLADCLEAIIGASWLDGGLKASQKIIKKLYSTSIYISKNNFNESNPKGMLQEYAQKQGDIPPEYNIISMTGPKHDPKFSVEVTYQKNKFIETCSSKRSAEKKAAQSVLDWINKEN